MLFICVCRENIKISLTVRRYRMPPQVAVKEAQLADNIELRIEDRDIASAPHYIDIGSVRIHTGRLRHIVAAVSHNRLAFVLLLLRASQQSTVMLSVPWASNSSM